MTAGPEYTLKLGEIEVFFNLADDTYPVVKVRPPERPPGPRDSVALAPLQRLGWSVSSVVGDHGSDE